MDALAYQRGRIDQIRRISEYVIGNSEVFHDVFMITIDLLKRELEDAINGTGSLDSLQSCA